MVSVSVSAAAAAGAETASLLLLRWETSASKRPCCGTMMGSGLAFGLAFGFAIIQPRQAHSAPAWTHADRRGTGGPDPARASRQGRHCCPCKTGALTDDDGLACTDGQFDRDERGGTL